MTMQPSDIRLSVVMPAYNEAATVAAAVERLRSVPMQMEIIAVDDGSTDGTRLILQQLHARGAVDQLVLQEVNQGKGAAVRAGIARAGGEIIVIQDADLEYDPREFPLLMQPILDGRADAVFGSRFLGGPHRVLYFWHRLANGMLTFLSNLLTNINLTDMETCYKMVRADLLKSLPLRSRRFGIEPELTALLARSGARIYEVPISYSGRTYAEGKKIDWRDGMAAVWHILAANLIYRMPGQGTTAGADGSGRGAGGWREAALPASQAPLLAPPTTEAARTRSNADPLHPPATGER